MSRTPASERAQQAQFLAAARAGDQRAFERLFAPAVPALRGLLTRMVGHPDDVDDLCQQALLRAFEHLDQFAHDAAPGTWLCAIGTRLAIDHLRGQRRFRERAQVIFAARAQSDPSIGADVAEALCDPNFAFDAREHIAYCFTCVGRSLSPENQAALVLRDVLGLSNDEAAKACSVTRSVLRHRLTEARSEMQTRFDNLCALVGKQGVCYQCAGLREVSPEDRQGEPPPATLPWDVRLETVRAAASRSGTARALHDVFFRHTQAQEQDELGDPDAITDCGRP